MFKFTLANVMLLPNAASFYVVLSKILRKLWSFTAKLQLIKFNIFLNGYLLRPHFTFENEDNKPLCYGSAILSTVDQIKGCSRKSSRKKFALMQSMSLSLEGLSAVCLAFYSVRKLANQIPMIHSCFTLRQF